VRGITELDLRGANVGSISDDKPSWPEKIKLHLDGFIYGSIPGNLRDASWRLWWLDRQTEFAPQPYRQLAKVLRDLGDDEGAKEVLSGLEQKSRIEARRRVIWAPVRWLKHADDDLSNAIVGYGIYPGRAIWLLGGLTALGWVVYRRANLAGAMAPVDKDAYDDFHAHGHPPGNCPPFNPLIYALENSVPLVKLGQDDHWQPDSTPTLRTPDPVTGWWAKLKRILLERWIPDRAISPTALRQLRWTMIIVGWLLATFFLAGLSGIIRTT